MKHVSAISQMKRSSLDEALSVRIVVRDEKENFVGYLIPVGDWLLSDEPVLQKISNWRRKFNRMFPTRTSVDSSTTKNFIRDSYVDNADAIFFLIFTESDELVGHIGLCSLDKRSFELANLIRGASGGHNDLIYLAELCLLDFGFLLGDYDQCHVEIMSYNWIVFELHQRVGFVKDSSTPLLKIVDSTGVRHQRVGISETNIDYTIDTLIVSKNRFYSLHTF